MIVLTVLAESEENAVTRLMSASGFSKYKVNQILEKLCQEGYVTLQKSRPKSYIINPDFMEETLKL
ncbi:helix-turn-helix domain-containing protein [Domibacillus sp. PGB-M46]|uniref:helix-turn-helix domain-containing protein n=1 Tax=Domibacillus sp. PGB-M46 TaxID=2910255 RepID=UPI0035C8ADC1